MEFGQSPHRHLNKEQRTWIEEQRTRNKEPRTRNKEQGPGNEQGQARYCFWPAPPPSEKKWVHNISRETETPNQFNKVDQQTSQTKMKQEHDTNQKAFQHKGNL